jgi:glycosyltransferase involved in cell wall biosynthesis
MLHGKKIVVVLPAFNAAKSLGKTLEEIPETVDELVLVDDCSDDDTYEVAQRLGLRYVIRHERNRGYGGNQKTCYREALKLDPDVIVMLHPDYQYSPKMIPALCSAIVYGEYDVALGSRILGKGALQGGMPLYKYIFNRLLTFVQNVLINQKLSEYHTGFRAYTADSLRSIDFSENSDDFIFDNELLCQLLMNRFRVCEVSCPTRYDKDSSSINFWRSVHYGLGVLRVSISYFVHKMGYRTDLFSR